MITIIAAVSENNIIGKDNDLIWHLPKDFKRFKELTSNHYIIMGRKTFESFPKPLPNRTHVIITRDKSYGDNLPENCYAFENVDSALEFSKTQENIYIIGGGEIYKQTMELSDKIELTRVHTEVEGDTLFPEIDDKWKLVEEVKVEKDDKHLYDFTYLTYIKK
jgi:dihydrofolate reductase